MFSGCDYTDKDQMMNGQKAQFRDAIVANPRAAFDRIAGEGGRRWDPETDTLYVTSPELVRQILGDARFRARGAAPLESGTIAGDDADSIEDLEAFLGRWPVFSDEGVQRQLIGVLRRRFSARAAEALRLTARVTFEEVVRRADPARPNESLAQPIAMEALRLILSRSDRDLALLREYTTSTMSYLMAKGQRPELARLALAEIDQLETMVERWMETPHSDPILQALAAEGTLTQATPRDVAALYAQLVTGTLDPTANTLVAALIIVEDDPTAMDLVAREEWEALTEFCLSRETGFHFATRRASCPVHIGGSIIDRGTRVVNVIAAAAHEEYEHGKSGRATLAFGHGAHYCLGAHTSRVLLQEGLRAASRLTRDPRWVTPERIPSFGGPLFGDRDQHA